MSKIKLPAQSGWTKPELKRLGTIRDVAGPGGAAAQSPIQDRS